MQIKCPSCGFENILGEDNCEKCGADLTKVQRQIYMRPKDPFEKQLVHNTVEEIAHCEYLLVPPETSIKDVAEALAHYNRCALVVQDDQLVGMVTVRRILHRAMYQGLDPETTPISQIMLENPETLNAEDKLSVALNKMSISGFRHIPIVKDQKIWGVISARDILAHLAETFPQIIEAQKQL